VVVCLRATLLELLQLAVAVMAVLVQEQVETELIIQVAGLVVAEQQEAFLAAQAALVLSSSKSQIRIAQSFLRV
jgi:hypothetical protein